MNLSYCLQSLWCFMRFKAILLLLIAIPAYAVEDAKLWPENKSKNFCLDQESAAENESIAKKNSTDERLVKLVALRAGLCDLLEKKIIDLNFAIDVFNSEKDNQIIKRMQEVQTSKHESNI